MTATLTISAGANNYASDQALYQGLTSDLAYPTQLAQFILDDASASWTVEENDSSQIVVTLTDAQNQTFHLVVQGSGLALNGPVTGNIAKVLASISGFSNNFQIVAGGTYGSGSITGGTAILTGSITTVGNIYEWNFATPAAGGGSIVTKVDGGSLPTSFVGTNGVGQFFNGTYAGGPNSSFSIGDVIVTDGATDVSSLTLGSRSDGSGSDTLVLATSGGALESLTVTGSTANSFTASGIANVLPSGFTIDSLIPIAGSIPFTGLLPVIATSVTGFSLVDNVSGNSIATLSGLGSGVAPGTNSATYLASLAGGTVDASATHANIDIGFGSGNGFLEIGGATLAVYPGSKDPATVIGGAGDNVATFNFAKSNYTIAITAAGVTVTPNSTAVNGASVITLKNFDELDFSDGSVVRFQRPAEDFNDDRSSDILFRQANGSVVDWLLHGGTLSASATLGVMGSTWSITGIGDFNGDLTSDVLWRNSSGDIELWTMSNGAIASNTIVGNLAISWTIAGLGDFNGDGKSDILWRNSTGELEIWTMNGATVTAQTSLGIVSSGWSVAAVGDFNGDGKADILWRSTTGAADIWFMNGTTVSADMSLGTVGTNWSVAGTGDFNGDGKTDILWRATNGDVDIWEMNGASVIADIDLGIVSSGWSVVEVGDFNGDGKADILWRNTSGALDIWTMNGGTITSDTSPGSTPSSWSVLPAVGGPISPPSTVITKAPSDFNNDGTSDILWRSTSGNVDIWSMLGGAVLADTSVTTVSSGWSVAAVADFTGDGKSDILWRNTAGAVDLWTMNGASIVSDNQITTVPSNWSVAGVGDFNGDHEADILWRNTSGAIDLWTMNGSTIAADTQLGTVSTSWSVVGTGDFNGDGMTDILWRNTAGTVDLWTMNGSSVAHDNTIQTVSTSWSVAGIGDFNGDGKADILWRNTNGDVDLWTMNGATVANDTDLGVVSTSWTVAQIGDFNGDGKADILWRNTTSGAVDLWTMNGAVVTADSSLGTVSTTWNVQKPLLASTS